MTHNEDDLVEAYQMDEDLYRTDKEMLDEEDSEDVSMPIHTYISTAVEQEQEEKDVTVTQ